MKSRILFAGVAAVFIAVAARAAAQCTPVLFGLKGPGALAWTNQGNLLVSETGDGTLHSGRISIVEPNGTRRTLLDGLPSARADVGEPSGPAGLVMRGRTLYLAMSVGDVAIRVPGMPPRTARANPAGPSSGLFSSILQIEFSAAMEKRTRGFSLTEAQRQALANGETVVLGPASDRLTIRVLANFPDFVPEPFPGFAPFPPEPLNVRVSNPFAVTIEGAALYVSDGGMNRVWRVNLADGSFTAHADFPNRSNPLFGVLGYPDVEAVPTGLALDGNQLLVSLFTGFPFAPGASSIQRVDPATGAAAPLITGRKNAIAVHAWKHRGRTSYFVLQFASVGAFFNSPGQLLRFRTASAAPALIADCFFRPTAMAIDEKNGRAYITADERLLVLPVSP
jgi:hypothetical protein